jgi:hypothetical protein
VSFSLTPFSFYTMHLEINGPRYESLNGKRQSFVEGRSGKLQTHRIEKMAARNESMAPSQEFTDISLDLKSAKAAGKKVRI